MSYVATYQVVDPERLVVVTHVGADQAEYQTVAVFCRYSPARDGSGSRVIAVEVVFDPARQAPAAPYRIPVGQLQRLVLTPSQLRRVRPYTVA